jgi:hypothetical protein
VTQEVDTNLGSAGRSRSLCLSHISPKGFQCPWHGLGRSFRRLSTNQGGDGCAAFPLPPAGAGGSGLSWPIRTRLFSSCCAIFAFNQNEVFACERAVQKQGAASSCFPFWAR